jgi:hypothetical protein
MRYVETILGMKGTGSKIMMEGVNLINIYYMYFCKCFNALPVQQ